MGERYRHCNWDGRYSIRGGCITFGVATVAVGVRVYAPMCVKIAFAGEALVAVWKITFVRTLANVDVHVFR